MANDYTQLNPGEGGDYMDEVSVTYSTAPQTRKRPRVVLTGPGLDQDAAVTSTTPADNAKGLVTRPIPGNRTFPGTDLVKFGFVMSVPSNVDTTVATYTVPTGKTAFVLGFNGSGLFKARYTLLLDGEEMLQGWTTAANLNIHLDFGGLAPSVAEAGIVQIRVLHGEAGFQTTFSGTILGYLV
jgi:hypothetical protein